MSDVTIFGPALSTYVRTLRIACEEKGVKYTLNELPFGSPEILKRFRHFVNSYEADSNIVFVKERGQPIPA